MSQGNVAKELQIGTPFPAPSSTVVKVINVRNTATARHTQNTACMLAYGTSVPSSVAGYLSSCLFLDTDAAADSQLLVNEGTLSSCSFVAQTT